MVCAFTGHRPQRLPWGSREDDPRCLALKQRLDESIAQAAARGCDTFLCGMARGCDTYFAEAVLKHGLRLEAVVPCPEQADRWPPADRERYRKLLLRSFCISLGFIVNAFIGRLAALQPVLPSPPIPVRLYITLPNLPRISAEGRRCLAIL